MQGLQHADEFLTEAVLEGDPIRVEPARHQHHLLVLHVHAFDPADALRKVEHLRFTERLGGEPAAVLLEDQRRVQALLDRGPDAEGWREDLVAGVVVHDQVGTVARAELLDLPKQVVRGVAGEDIREPRLDAHAHQGKAAGGLPVGGLRELVVAEHDPGLAVGVRGVRFGQAHGHVEVVTAGGERPGEHRGHELRLDRVHHVGGAVPERDGGDHVRVAGVDLLGGEPGCRRVPVLQADCDDGAFRPGQVVVAHDDVLEERALGARASVRPCVLPEPIRRRFCPKPRDFAPIKGSTRNFSVEFARATDAAPPARAPPGASRRPGPTAARRRTHRAAARRSYP